MRHSLLLASVAFGVALGGCLAVPDTVAPECVVTSDCDTANGEVCEEGVCWGNPPPGPFAAIVSPPSERKNDLVGREFVIESIPADGYLFDVMLELPVMYTGMVRAICPPPSTACNDIALGAQIVVTRPSLFEGGPSYRQVVESDPGTGTFAIALPRTRAEDPPYTVTVFPDGRDAEPNEILTAQEVPPLRTEIRAVESVNGNTFDLGTISPRIIDGKITDTNGFGQQKYRVVATGRWDNNSPITEVSTVFYTGTDGRTDGHYSLRLADGLPDNVAIEIVAKPYGETLPTLHQKFTLVGQASANRSLIAPDVGNLVKVPLTIRGSDPSGEVVGVVGAQVEVTGVIPAGAPGLTFSTYLTGGVTDGSGVVELDLLDGSLIQGSYRVSVVPTAGAPVGVLFDEPLAGATVKRLPDRIALRGKVHDVNGRPLAGAQVTVRPSVRFQWSLSPNPQAFVAAIPAANTVTLPTGEYLVFVDPFVFDAEADIFGADIFGHYDVAFDATPTTPAYTAFDIEIPRDTQLSELRVPDLGLPDAAHVHGVITDADGIPIEGGELKLFQSGVVAGIQLCDQVEFEPPGCPIPAIILGRGASDLDGKVRLSLPRR